MVLVILNDSFQFGERYVSYRSEIIQVGLLLTLLLILKISHEVILLFFLSVFFVCFRSFEFISLCFVRHDVVKFMIHFESCRIIVLQKSRVDSNRMVTSCSNDLLVDPCSLRFLYLYLVSISQVLMLKNFLSK